jgi:hypothetical protein
MITKERLLFGILALAGGLIGGLISGSFVAGRNAPASLAGAGKDVSAPHFLVVDKNGRRRGSFGVSERDVAGFDLDDANGVIRAQLGVLPGGTSLFDFFDQDRKPVAAFNADPKGTAELAFFNPNGSTRAEFAMAAGEPAILLCDHNGNKLLRIDLEHELPAVALYDAQGNWRSLMTVNQDGTPEFGLADQSSRPRAMLGLQSDGRATFVMTDDTGKALSILGQMPDGAPSLKLMGQDGAVVGSIP